MTCRWWPVVMAALLLPVVSVGQEVEWITRIPRMGRTVLPSTPCVDTAHAMVYVSKSRPSAEFRSTDGGRTWSGGPRPELEDMVFNRWTTLAMPDGALLATGGYAGSGEWGSLFSTDRGQTWQRLPADPAMGVADGRMVLRSFVPPRTIIATATYATTAEYQTTDLGTTWTLLTDPPPRTDVSIPAFSPMPDVRAIAGDAVWLRRNVITETSMARTDLPLSVRTWVESDVGGVAALEWAGHAVRVKTAPSEAYRVLDRVMHPDVGREVTFTPADLLAVDDSTAICVAENGLVIRVDLYRGTLSLIVDAGRLLGSSSSTYEPFRLLRYRNTIVLEYSENTATTGVPARIIVAYDRRTGLAHCVRRPRRRTAMVKGLATEALVGDRSLVLVAEDLDWADVLQSDDFGATWWFPDRINVEGGVAPLVGIRRSVRDAEGRLWMVTDRDQLVLDHGERRQEMRYPATDAVDWGLTGTPRDLWLGFIEHRRPTIVAHQGRVLRMDSVCGIANEGTGEVADTLLPEAVAFFHVLDDGRYAAGRTHLWLGDGAHGWERRDIAVPAAPADVRGSISDVVRTTSGDLVVALRGWSFAHSVGEAHVARWGGLVRSTDDGVTWQAVASWPEERPFVTRLARTSGGALLAWATAVVVDTTELDPRTGSVRPVLQGGGIYRSADDGATWDLVYSDRTNRLPHPGAEPDFLGHHSGILFSTTYTGLLVRSADDGRTWAIDDPPGIGSATIGAVDVDSDGVVRLSTSEGVCRYKASGTVSVHRSNVRPAGYSLVLGPQRQLAVTTSTTITSVTITDIVGRRIGWWQGHGSTDVVIDGSAWLAGLYLVTIDGGSAPYTGTVFVW